MAIMVCQMPKVPPRPVRFWIVAVDDPRVAEMKVAEVAPESYITATPYPVSVETLAKIGLNPGEVWQL